MHAYVIYLITFMSLHTYIYICMFIDPFNVNDACEHECFFKSMAAWRSFQSI